MHNNTIIMYNTMYRKHNYHGSNKCLDLLLIGTLPTYVQCISNGMINQQIKNKHTKFVTTLYLNQTMPLQDEQR